MTLEISFEGSTTIISTPVSFHIYLTVGISAFLAGFIISSILGITSPDLTILITAPFPILLSDIYLALYPVVYVTTTFPGIVTGSILIRGLRNPYRLTFHSTSFTIASFITVFILNAIACLG